MTQQVGDAREEEVVGLLEGTGEGEGESDAGPMVRLKVNCVWTKRTACSTSFVQAAAGSNEPTVMDIKHAMRLNTGVPPEKQRLVFGGAELADRATLRAARVNANVTLHMMLRRASPSAP